MSKAIDQIPEADRPREKLLRKGAASLTDQELLAVLLGKGTPGMDVMTLAGKLSRLMDEKGLEVKAEDLTQFEGVGDAKATLILAAIEFARRRTCENTCPVGYFNALGVPALATRAGNRLPQNGNG
jgi:DNA repair protein RadC